MKPDDATERDLIEVLERFCSRFAERDADAVTRLFVADPSVVVVTSEEPLLRGLVELRRFLDSDVEGVTTYSWQWYRHDISTAESFAWLIAGGTEAAATGGHVEEHPYRLTMVLECRENRWMLRHVHGSSPH